MAATSPNLEEQQEMPELRRAPRLVRHISLAYSFYADSARFSRPAPFRFGMLRNISEYGACFEADDLFRERQVLLLYLKFTDETGGVRMLANVIWTRLQDDGRTRIGVRFIGNLPADWRQVTT
jgi:hypothetical protein